MIAGIYLRISQDRAGTELGVTRQREDCEALVARRGWTVHDTYVDNDASAKRAGTRPQFKAMLAAVRAGQLKAVVAWDMTRLSRNPHDRLALVEACREYNVIISLVHGSDRDPTTFGGRVVIGIDGEYAEEEIRVKSERQRRANEQAALQGRWVGGRRPFGYEPDGVTVRPVEAEAVKAAFGDYLAGTPISAIAKRWNAAGLLSGMKRRDGTPTQWTHSGVRNLLRNPRYAGLRTHNPGSRSANVRERRIVGKAEWPALVTESTYRAVVALLDSSASQSKPHGGRRLLTGVARCATCDAPIVAGGGRAGGPQLYRCPRGHVVRRAEPVEDLIADMLLTRMQRPDFLSLLAARADDGHAAALGAEAERLREEMDTIALERTQRKITPRQFTLMNAELVAQLEATERQMTSTGGSSAIRDFVKGGVTKERWGALDVDQQRVFIATAMGISLLPVGRGVRNPPPETVQVTWKR